MEEKQYDQQSSYYSDNVSSDVDDVMASAVQQFKRTSNRRITPLYLNKEKVHLMESLDTQSHD